MPENPDHWFLKKHDDGEVFGPVRFDQIVAWARSAQINPQDMVSGDAQVWTKAPMVPELEMDWLVEVGESLLYGPTTTEAVMEFARLGEIHKETPVVNCRTAESMPLHAAPFYVETPPRQDDVARMPQPPKGGIKISLQKRVRDLEAALIEKRLQLTVATDTISKLEGKIRDLEKQIVDLRARRI